MALSYQYTLSPANLWENGKTAAWVPITADDGGYYNVGAGAKWKWTTAARRMEVDVYATVADKALMVGVRVYDGVTCRDYWGSAPQAGVVSTITIPLPAGAAKTVELIVPGQYAVSAGGAPLGVYPMRVRFDAVATALAPDTPANRLVIYGDSIAAGGVAISHSHFGYAGLMKKGSSFGGYAGRVTLVAHGYRRLTDDCASGGAQTAFAAALLALSPTKIVLAIGSNDHSVVPNVPVATFSAQYAGLLDAIHAASGSMPIVCVSPILRGVSSEVANSLSETMSQFRTAISSAVSARSGWSVPPAYVDGSAICTFADLGDAVHPHTTAHRVKMLPAFLAAVA